MHHPLRSVAWMIVYALGNALMIATLGRLVGLLVFVPALVSFITAWVITYSTFLERPVVLVVIMLGSSCRSGSSSPTSCSTLGSCAITAL
jgi:hypothetical protein